MWQAFEYHAMRLIVLSPLLLLVLGQATVARSAYYPKPMLRCNERTAFAEWVKVVNGQVGGLAAYLAPRTLTSHLAAQLAPRWVKVWVRLAFLPSALRRSSMGLASVADHRQHAAVKARSLEGHALGNSGSVRYGAITLARCSVMRSVASVYCGS